MNSQQNAALKEIQLAVAAKDPAKLELALNNAYRVELQGDFVETLNHLLESDWHTRHEDITLCLQQMEDPRSVDVLFKTAQRKFDYVTGQIKTSHF